MLDRLLGHRGAPRSVADLRDRGLNYDPARIEEYVAREGWHRDALSQPLPGEPPGQPLPGGSFETAQRLMRDYSFAEGSAITGIFEQDAALEGRDMILRASFYGLHFNLGVRVGDVVDRHAQADGRPVRIWGWSYGTLEGHLERGRMGYEVWKWLDTGAVEFRIDAASHRARIANPLVRLGMALFARREQLKFHRHVCARMAALVGREAGRAGGGGRLASSPP